MAYVADSMLACQIRRTFPPVFSTGGHAVFCAPADPEGGFIAMRKPYQLWLLLLLGCFVPGVVSAQTPTAQGGGPFMLQCPSSTAYHPTIFPSGAPEPEYTGPAPLDVTLGGVRFSTAVNSDNQHPPYINNGGQIKYQANSLGDR